MFEMKTLPGDHITNAISRALGLAQEHEQVRFDFNGVEVIVAADSNPELILREWSRRMDRLVTDGSPAGPYPAAELTPEEVESDNRIRAEQERQDAERRAEWERKEAEQRAALDAKLREAPAIELRDPEGWATAVTVNSKDAYSNAVMRYAEQWARLMQVEIAAGKTVAECAKDTSHEADIEGITGFMYGCAVGILAQLWIHGEELRRWHNRDVQIGDEGLKANAEGGVLNPALLNLAPRE